MPSRMSVVDATPENLRQGKATGPDAELQDRAAPGRGREKLHGALGAGGQARQVVVHVGDALAVGRHVVRPRRSRPAGLGPINHGRGSLERRPSAGPRTRLLELRGEPEQRRLVPVAASELHADR